MNWLKSFWQKLTAPPPRKPRTTSVTIQPTNNPAPPVMKSSGTPRVPEPSVPNFSPLAQQTLALARKKADRFNHNFVGTEHLLLGMIALGQGVGVTVMHNLGLDLDAVRAEVEKHIGIGPDQKMFGKIPYTPRVKKVLALAAKEAMAMKDTYVGTNHIVLGFLREGDGVAGRVLKSMNVDLEKARAEVMKVRETNPSSSAEETVANKGASEEQPDPTVEYTSSFTPRAQHALDTARKEAERLNLAFVGPEHVLLGLIGLGQGVAVIILTQLGLDLKTVAAEVEALAGSRPNEKIRDPVVFAPLVKQVLAFAAEEAKNLDHTYIGTEHILLALLREPHGGAAQIFKKHNIDTEALRGDILKELNPNVVTASAPETSIQPKRTHAKMHREPVDTNQRYDVYCAPRNQDVMIYRNVRFKAVKTLFQRHDHDYLSDFVELEQPDGQSIFVAKSTIVRFCPPGAKPEGTV